VTVRCKTAVVTYDNLKFELLILSKQAIGCLTSDHYYINLLPRRPQIIALLLLETGIYPNYEGMDNYLIILYMFPKSCESYAYTMHTYISNRV